MGDTDGVADDFYRILQSGGWDASVNLWCCSVLDAPRTTGGEYQQKRQGNAESAKALLYGGLPFHAGYGLVTKRNSRCPSEDNGFLAKRIRRGSLINHGSGTISAQGMNLAVGQDSHQFIVEVIDPRGYLWSDTLVVHLAAFVNVIPK